MVRGKNRIPYWIDWRLTGLAEPDYGATISFGLPIEPEDSQYGKYRVIPSVVGGATDTLRGKEAVGKYWRAALDRFPDLAFKLADVLVAQNSLVIYYRSVSDKMAAEVMIFGEDGKVVKAMAHYAD